MEFATQEIELVLEDEHRAWEEGNVALLLSIFHPDAVWMWPRSHDSFDPLEWEMTVGRFDADRWQKGWSRILSCELLRNHRDVRRIEISPERDAAVAVVDVDVEWRNPNGSPVRWAGRAVKYYTKASGAWKLIAQTGL